MKKKLTVTTKYAHSLFAYLKNPELLDEIKASATNSGNKLMRGCCLELFSFHGFLNQEGSGALPPQFAMGSGLAKLKSALPRGPEATTFSLVLACLVLSSVFYFRSQSLVAVNL